MTFWDCIAGEGKYLVDIVFKTKRWQKTNRQTFQKEKKIGNIQKDDVNFYLGTACTEGQITIYITIISEYVHGLFCIYMYDQLL